MKKLVLFMTIMPLIVLTSCGDDDEYSGFPSDVKTVIQSLNGTWVTTDAVSPETITFSAFDSPTEIAPASSSFARMEFHGSMTRDFVYLGKETEHWDMYFYINTDKKEIHAYGKSEENGGWSLSISKVYDYAIVDANTITLHDQSQSWMNTYTFRRK